MGVAEDRFYPLVAHPLLTHEDVYTLVDHAFSAVVAEGWKHEILVILQPDPLLFPVLPHRRGGRQDPQISATFHLAWRSIPPPDPVRLRDFAISHGRSGGSFLSACGPSTP